MDHVLNKIMPYVEVELMIFMEEWRSGKYEKHSECPSYKSLKALVDAANKILKYMEEERLNIRKMIERGAM